MKSRRNRSDLHAYCGQVQSDDCIDPREAFRRGGFRRQDRKGQQLCKQVHRALSFAVSECRDPLLHELEIVSVNLAPDATHLLVTVRPTARRPAIAAHELSAHLRDARSFLRSQVAAAITRRRAPDLSFQVLPAPEVHA